VVSGAEPILPHSIELQENWSDAELYPHSSFTVYLAPSKRPKEEVTVEEPCKSCVSEKGHLTQNCPKRGGERGLKDQQKLYSGCPQSEMNVVVGSDSIHPRSVKIQHDWVDVERYPNSSFTFKPAPPSSSRPMREQNEPREVESKSEEDDEYSSSEDEGEVFIRGALNKKRRGAPKEYLPKHQEPVVKPLTVEERVKRKETRVMNRETSRQRNLTMIKAIAGETMDKLATHKHIKHFRSDLHKFVDLSFNHVKDVPETMNVARLKVAEDQETEVVELPKGKDLPSGNGQPSFITGANRVPLKGMAPEGRANIKIDVDPKSIGRIIRLRL